MSFSCKIVTAGYQKRDGTRMVYLQAIIDRMSARVPLGFYIHEDQLNKKGFVKTDHANANDFNIEILNATAKANKIASRFRQKGKALTPELFKAEFVNPADEVDLIKFMRNELNGRNDVAMGTRKHRHSVINKLESFQKKIRFGEVNDQLLKRFKNWLIREGNAGSTLNQNLKVIKQYLNEARKQGYEFEDPFLSIRIKNYKSNRNALSESELKVIENYYASTKCPASHKRLLQYFIFSCYTGLRISDIGLITWDNIKDNGSMLEYFPEKTKGKKEVVRVPLLEHDHKFLPEFNHKKGPIFETFSHQVNNRYLKKISDVLDLRKRITYHTARHTFASLMVEGGHLAETQKMLGHEDIKTTMGYVHTSTQSLIKAKKERFENMKTGKSGENPK